MEKLKDIGSFDQEWKKSKRKLKRKLKLRFWFYQNISGIALVGLFLLYWMMQSQEISLLVAKIQFLFKWIFQFLMN
jgi:hypothetical protein